MRADGRAQARQRGNDPGDGAWPLGDLAAWEGGDVTIPIVAWSLAIT